MRDPLPVEFLDPAQAAVAAAYWAIGYAAALDRTWRDRIPAGVRILDDFDFGTNRQRD